MPLARDHLMFAYRFSDYIPLDDVSKAAIEFEWNDWDPFEPLGEPDEETKTVLERMSNYGITAFALGCAEWVVARLLRSIRESSPLEYLDAFWYFLLGGSDTPPPPTDDQEWEGPVLGPINLALMTVLNTIYLSEDGPPVQNGALSAQIVLHVLPTSARGAFLAWQATVLNRLSLTCRRRPESPDGGPIPRGYLNPAIDLATYNASSEVQHDLASISVATNRFLRRSEGAG